MNQLNSNADEEITLLVLERGADWPTWGAGLRTRAGHSAVEVQADGESAAEFQARVLERLSSIKKQGTRIRAAGYACSLEGVTRRESRRFLCMTLLGAIHPGADAELILAGGAWEPTGIEGQERIQLIQLWSDLSETQPDRVMSIRFEVPQSESGVYRATPIMAPHRLMP